MRPDLVGPRPLKPAEQVEKSELEWLAPFQTDEIEKSLMSGVSRIEDVLKSIYGLSNLRKAGVAAVAKQHSKPEGSVSEFGSTQPAVPRAKQTGVKPPAQATGTSKISGLPRLAGELPDVSRRAAVSEPGHKLAMARAHLDHHAYEYHRNNQIAGDTTAHPEQRVQAKTLRDEHQRLGTNARKVINSFEAQGVKDTKKHHADMVLHYEQNKETPRYAGGVIHPLQPSGKQLARHHNPRSGSEWDKHYGVPEGIAWHKPEAREAYRQMLDKPYRSAKVKQKPATESLTLEPPEEPTKEFKVKKSVELSKAVSSYQKKRMREDAAHALFNHHVAKIRGNHDEARQHLDRATSLSKQAGAGPTKGMMQSHVNVHKEEWDRTQKVSRGPGVQTAGVGAEKKMTGGAATLHNLAKENYQAATAATTHPLVGSKHPAPVEKSFPLRSDMIGPRPLRKA
jgi:hypothetical protein